MKRLVTVRVFPIFFRLILGKALPTKNSRFSNQSASLIQQFFLFTFDITIIAGTSTGSADPAPLYLNAAGCYTKVSEWVVTYSAALIGAACGVAVFEVIVIVAASIFCHQLKNQSY